MSKTLRTVCIAVIIAAISITAAFGAAAKPAAKPSALGTTQLAGGWGEFGKEYTVGKNNPINIIMKSAEFTVGQVRIGDNIFYPKAEEKMLVLHYTMRNPQKEEIEAYPETWQFTVVDATNTNREYLYEVGMETNKSRLEAMIKPAQKIECYTIIPVPAKGVIPKLIIKAQDDQVIRYDLKDKVKKLAAPFVDPVDKTGCTALEQVPAKPATFYPTGIFDVQFDQAAYKDGTIADYEPEEGNRFLEVFVTIKNNGPVERELFAPLINPTLRTTDGDDLEWNCEMLHAKRDAAVETDLKPGKEIKARFYFEVPEDVELESLLLQESEDDRIYQFDLTSVK